MSVPPMDEAAIARFFKSFTTGNGCWLWTGTLHKEGYGSFYWGSAKCRGYGLAHRIAWALSNGPAPSLLCVCHRCDVRRCVRPDHLFLGTHADNQADKVRKGRQRAGAPRMGAANHAAKLTEAQVGDIRERWAAGEKRILIAQRYGVSRQQIKDIGRRRAWRHLP